MVADNLTNTQAEAESDTMSYDEQLARMGALEQSGLEIVNDSQFIGRIPPEVFCGMNPLAYFPVYEADTLCNQLSVDLAAQGVRPAAHFDRGELVAEFQNVSVVDLTNESAPSFTLNNNLNLG